MAEATEGLVYRGHPLRRVDNLIYYGSMADKYIVMMQVGYHAAQGYHACQARFHSVADDGRKPPFARPCGPLDGKREPWRGDGICLHLA